MKNSSLGQTTLDMNVQTRGQEVGEQPHRKGSGSSRWQSVERESAVCPGSPEGQLYPQDAPGPALLGEDRDCPTPLCAVRPHLKKKNGISGERFWKTIIEVTTAVSKWWFLKNTVIFQLKSKKGNTQRLHKHLPEEIMTLFLSFWLVLLAYPKICYQRYFWQNYTDTMKEKKNPTRIIWKLIIFC